MQDSPELSRINLRPSKRTPYGPLDRRRLTETTRNARVIWPRAYGSTTAVAGRSYRGLILGSVARFARLHQDGYEFIKLIDRTRLD